MQADTPSLSEYDPSGSTDRIHLFTLSLDLLCVAGLNGYFKQVNPSWTRVLGWTEEELLSRPVESFVHPEDRDRTLKARASLKQGNPLRGFENRYLCKDGAYRWLSWQCTIQEGAEVVFGVARDITERRQSDLEKLVMSKLESAGTLASGIAHDFNNILTGLQLNLDMLELTGPLNPRQLQHLSQAQSGVLAARALTQQLVSFSCRGTPSGRQTIALHDLLRQTFDLALVGTNILGDCRIASGLWSAEVNADEITQVIRSLVLNARDAMSSGGTLLLQANNVTLNAEYGPEYPSGDYVRISLTDEGTGISNEDLPRIFDPYFSTKKRGKQKGMGLGLSICRAILQKHGGMITIDPAAATPGTTVVCYLPAVINQAGVLESVVVERSNLACSGRILVMDDEPAVLEIMSQTLSQLGYKVRLARNGEEAIDHFEQARRDGLAYDLILLDLTIRGGLGGLEVIQRLRSQGREVPAVLMTGYDSEKAVAEYLNHGFLAVLAKPFNLESLRALLDDFMPSVSQS